MQLRPYFRRWADWRLTTDKRQRIRLAMSGLAALLMVCCLVVMNSVAAAGLASTSEVRVWTACSVLGLIAVYAAIRSGWSRRFKDPALTLAQILYAITCCAVAFVIAGPARGVTLPILAIILMFGIFGLTTRQMLGVLVYSLVAFGLASGVVAARDEPDYPPVVAAAYVGMVVVVLLSSTFLTTRVQSTREHLRRQKAELAQALEQIRQLATHDDLTGLLNRRAMLDRMQLEQRRSLRSGSPLLIAQLDIDHVKAVNDTHGHAAGDLVLQRFADTVRRNVRDTDVLARWGGRRVRAAAVRHPRRRRRDPDGAPAPGRAGHAGARAAGRPAHYRDGVHWPGAACPCRSLGGHPGACRPGALRSQGRGAQPRGACTLPALMPVIGMR